MQKDREDGAPGPVGLPDIGHLPDSAPEAELDAALRAEKVWMEDDPRRERYLRTALEVDAMLREAEAADKERAIAVQKIADSRLKANEQYARAVSLDLKRTQDVSRLTTAAAVMGFVAQFERSLSEVEERLRRDSPGEYEALKAALASRQRGGTKHGG